MTDERRPDNQNQNDNVDNLVDNVLNPDAPLGDKRPEHARRRPSTSRRGSSKRGSSKGGSSQRPPRKRGSNGGWSRVLVWVLILAVLAAGSWYGWGYLNSETGDGDEAMRESLARQQIPTAGDRSVILVFPEWDASGYVTEERQIPSRDRGGEDLLGVIQVLCQGPVVSGAVSALPAGTYAQSAFFNPEDNSVVIDFSEELVTGHPGGSSAEIATLTSILRTVALNFPHTRKCVILVDGSQVETLAGHLIMDRPFDPKRWL